LHVPKEGRLHQTVCSRIASALHTPNRSGSNRADHVTAPTPKRDKTIDIGYVDP
jgi:hypothetical protein